MIIRYIDLFCGIGGIRTGLNNAAERLAIKTLCVLSSDIKKKAVETYELNYHEKVIGDITKIDEKNIPDFDVLLGGFPCQAFSNAGKRLGFEDVRGTLFFDVARIIKEKKPKSFILENVPGLVSHGGVLKGEKIGVTLLTILNVLEQLDYKVVWKLLNAKNHGSVQNRERVYIVGVRSDLRASSQVNSVFDIIHKPNKIFADIREYHQKVSTSDFAKSVYSLNAKSSLLGKAIKDKRGGVNNIHSWDLEYHGVVSSNQKLLLCELLKQRRYKKWAQENGTAWFDGMPLNLSQIKQFKDYNGVESDLDDLVGKGYLKKSFVKDFSIIKGQKVKVERKDLPMGYTMPTGKLSFEFSYILDDLGHVPTIVATDGIKNAVLDVGGLRTLTDIELKRLFGFSDDFNTSNLKKADLFDLFGNSVSINVIEEVAYNLLKIID